MCIKHCIGIKLYIDIKQALTAAEDETDRQAGRILQAEQKAELAEFEEDPDEPNNEEEKEIKVESELSMLTKEVFYNNFSM